MSHYCYLYLPAIPQPLFPKIFSNVLFQVIISHRLILNLILVSTVGGVQSQIWLAVSIGFAVIVPIFAEIQNSSFFSC